MDSQKGLPQIVWKAAQVWSGKAVGAVPEKGEEVLIIRNDGFYDFGSYGVLLDGYAIVEGEFDYVAWRDVLLWASLPPLDLDDDGNVKGLPF